MKANITESPASQEIYPDKIIILGTEIPADFCDAELYDHLEEIRKGLVNYKPTETANMGNAIREQCELIFECFDELFGEGTAQRVFGGKTNLRLCLQAFTELMTQANRQVANVSDSVKPYTANRAQRRLLNNG